MASLLVLNSDINELNDVNLRLAKDGMRSDLSTDHKLRYVWRLLQRTEGSLQSALDDVAHLRRQQTREMIEVENYMAQIRQSSERQKIMMSDYEQENESLKLKLNDLSQINDSYINYSNDISVILADIDAPENIMSSNLSEQIQFIVDTHKTSTEIANENVCTVSVIEDDLNEALESFDVTTQDGTEEASINMKVERLITFTKEANETILLLRNSIEKDEEQISKLEKQCFDLKTDRDSLESTLTEFHEVLSLTNFPKEEIAISDDITYDKSPTQFLKGIVKNQNNLQSEKLLFEQKISVLQKLNLELTSELNKNQESLQRIEDLTSELIEDKRIDISLEQRINTLILKTSKIDKMNEKLLEVDEKYTGLVHIMAEIDEIVDQNSIDGIDDTSTIEKINKLLQVQENLKQENNNLQKQLQTVDGILSNVPYNNDSENQNTIEKISRLLQQFKNTKDITKNLENDVYNLTNTVSKTQFELTEKELELETFKEILIKESNESSSHCEQLQQIITNNKELKKENSELQMKISSVCQEKSVVEKQVDAAMEMIFVSQLCDNTENNDKSLGGNVTLLINQYDELYNEKYKTIQKIKQLKSKIISATKADIEKEISIEFTENDNIQTEKTWSFNQSEVPAATSNSIASNEMFKSCTASTVAMDDLNILIDSLLDEKNKYKTSMDQNEDDFETFKLDFIKNNTLLISDYETKIQNLQVELSDLLENRTQSESLVEQIDSKQDELENIRSRNNKLSSDIETCVKENQSFKENIKDLKNEIHHYKTDLSHKEETIENLSKEIEELKSSLRNMKLSHKEALESLSKHHEEAANRSFQKYQEEYEEMEEERKRYNKLVKDMKVLREKNTYLEKDNKLLQEEIAFHNKEVEDTKTQLETLTKESSDQLAKATEQQKILLDEERVKWEMKLREVQEKYEEKLVKQQEVKSKQKSVAEERKVLRRSLSSSTTKLNILEEKYNALTLVNKQLELSLNVTKETVERYKSDYEALLSSKKQLKTKLSTLKSSFTNQNKEFEQMKENFEKEVLAKDKLLAKKQELHKKQINHLTEFSKCQSERIVTMENQLDDIKSQNEKYLQTSEEEMLNFRKRFNNETEKTNYLETQASKAKNQNLELKKELERVQQQYSEEIVKLTEENTKLQTALQESTRKHDEKLSTKDYNMSEIWELREENANLQKVVLTQEEKIGVLTDEASEWRQKCSSLTSTLKQCENLNTEVQKKLDEYSQRRINNERMITTLSNEKEVLQKEVKTAMDKLDMEQTKFNLLFTKLKNDSENEKCELHKNNTSLQVKLQKCEEQIIEMKNLLEQKNKMLKRSTSEMVKLKADLTEQTSEYDKLKQENYLLKAVERNTDKRLLNSDESLIQLQEKLMKKCAECKAINVSKNTLQDKLDIISKENIDLQATTKTYEETCHNLQVKINTMQVQVASIDEKNEKLENLESKLTIVATSEQKSIALNTTLKKEINSLRQNYTNQNEMLQKLENNVLLTTEESHTWKERYTEAKSSLVRLEHEQSGNAIVELKNQNQDLRKEISKLKEKLEVVKTDLNCQRTKLFSEFERIRDRSKSERRSLETITNQLKSSLDLAQYKIDNEVNYEKGKLKDCKELIHDKAELFSKLISLEEKLQDSERCRQTSINELTYLKDENNDLKHKNEQLNVLINNLSTSTVNYTKNRTIGNQPHSRTMSEDSRINTSYWLKDLHHYSPIRRNGDGGSVLSIYNNSSSKENIT